MIKLGSHVPFKAPKYLVGAISTSLANGANCAMIYLGAPQNTKRIEVDKYGLDEYQRLYADKIPPIDIVVHAPYVVNPANPELKDFAVEFLTSEMLRMRQAGFKYMVLHPGAFTKYNVEVALATLTESLIKILENTKHTQVEIVLETMSGKGSEIGVTFEQLLTIINNINDPRLGICLDTCHMWDAGYDLHHYEDFMKNEIVDKNVLPLVKVIHLNDSKNPLNSHKDRHENINQGYIGLETLAKFVHDPRFDNVPIVLETPVPDSGAIYDQEIKMLLEAK